MNDLEDGDVLLPPDTDTASTLEVIPVHEDMHGEVESDGNPRHSGQTDQLSVAQQGGSAMVIGVQEGQRLLLEEKEDRVNEFQILGQIRELSRVSLQFIVSNDRQSLHSTREPAVASNHPHDDR